ncbi:MAG: hypothetical protein J6J36_07105 [Clostridia bacterium]|nr:hypothetical protein [Clostridia bacterium]
MDEIDFMHHQYCETITKLRNELSTYKEHDYKAMYSTSLEERRKLSELVVELKTENAELKNKLTKDEKELEKWSTEYARAYVNRQNDLIAENAQLKKQLAEKGQELEDVRNTHIYRFYLDKDKVQDVYMTDVMLKVFNQDKISFAEKKLNTVKEIIEETLDRALKNSSLNQGYYDGLLDEIDKQIKLLEDEVKTNEEK